MFTHPLPSFEDKRMSNVQADSTTCHEGLREPIDAPFHDFSTLFRFRK